MATRKPSPPPRAAVTKTELTPFADAAPPADATQADEPKVVKRAPLESMPRLEVSEVDIGEFGDESQTAEDAVVRPSDELSIVERISLPDLVDDASVEMNRDSLLDDAPTAKPHMVALTKGAAAKAEAVRAEVKEEETSDVPTIIRPSPLDEQDEEDEESADEPTLLRASPLDEEGEESADEPTLLRASPRELAEAEAARTETPKAPQDASSRSIRVELAPELLAQAASEIRSTEETPKTAKVVEEDVEVPVTPGPPEALFVEEPPEKPVRAPKPRSAPMWGILLAMVALAGAGVVVGLDKGWIPRLTAPTEPTATALPTAVATLEPTAANAPTGEPAMTAAPSVTGQDPTVDLADAGDAATAESADAGAGTDAGTDAGTGTDAGAGTDAGTPADAGAPATAPTSQPASAAPAGDPASLPEKKGYLIVNASASVHVYVQGARAGMTNESLEVDCGPKFIRLGEPPATAPPGGGAGAVKWRSEGKSTVVACRSVTTMTITPTP